MGDKDNISEARTWAARAIPLKDMLIMEFWSIVCYQPPMGIVGLYTVTHLAATGRLFRLYPAAKGDKESFEFLLKKQQAANDSGSSRSFVLDTDDLAYRRLGGIDYVRHKLLRAALLPYYQQIAPTTHKAAVVDSRISTNEDAPVISESQEQLLNYVWNALAVTCTAGSSKRQFAEEMIPLFSLIEAFRPERGTTSPIRETSEDKDSEILPSLSTLDQLLLIGVKCSEVRMMDTLLRLCRDRLLQRTHQLARKVSRWNRRVEANPFLFSQKQLERDRLRLAYVKAAYQTEIEKLGILVQLLKSRPSDIPEQKLLDALQASDPERKENSAKSTKSSGEDTTAAKADNSWWIRTRQAWQGILESLNSTSSFRNVSQELTWERLQENIVNVWNVSVVSLRRLAEEAVSKLLSVQRLEPSVDIFGPAATKVLLEPCNEYKAWLRNASQWLLQSRSTVLHILHESLKGNPSVGGFDEHEFTQLQRNWFLPLAPCDPCDSENTEMEGGFQDMASKIALDWTNVLQYVDSLPHQQSMVEGGAASIGDVPFASWTRRLNIFGLPLVAVKVALARNVHFWVKPYWPQLRKEAKQVASITLGIVDQRFWVPFKGIYNEIMNQGKGIMSGFGLGLEEKSLDHMLMDLGFGDGTAQSRQKALERAATQYEEDLSKGLLLNVASGRLVRLMLVQVQQLKVGMLSALDTIDVLVKGNQIHFQILAAIPAVLIVTYGTKLFIRGLYNIRAKDLRPINAAHTEMTTYLIRLEFLVLQMSVKGPTIATDKEQDNPSLVQTPDHDSALMGEALFYIHRYLILLDFSRLSVPSRDSEEVHLSMLQLLEALSSSASNTGELYQASELTRNMQWVRLVKERHEKLKQYF